MHKLKKVTLLIFVVSVLAIGCKNAQQGLNSSVELMEDGTSIPAEAPVSLKRITGDKRKPFPSESDLWLDRKEINKTVIGGKESYTIKIRTSDLGQQGPIAQFIGRSKMFIQKTLVEKTPGTHSATDILSNITFEDGGFAHKLQHYVNIESGMAYSLGSAGQYAKIKLTIFFVDEGSTIYDADRYQPGTRDIWILVRRP